MSDETQHTNAETAFLRNKTNASAAVRAWNLIDKPGVIIEIDKRELHVDPTYQRDVSAKDTKVQAIAASWSWVACGAIIVAMRNGKAHVVDGQHRVLASLLRPDINMLPCIVFETTGVEHEAKAFLQANTFRKPMKSSDQFRALVVAGDPTAIKVHELIRTHGRGINSSGDSPTGVRCVAAVMRCAMIDWDVLQRVYPVINQICSGRGITQQLVLGLWHIERWEVTGKSLTDKRWRDRLNKVGAEGLETSARKLSAYLGQSGEKVWARGMVDALNKGLREDLLELPAGGAV